MSSYSEIFGQKAQFKNIIANSLQKIGGSELETMSLLFEDDYFHMLLESMKEAKTGKVVSFSDAFSDLD